MAFPDSVDDPAGADAVSNIVNFCLLRDKRILKALKQRDVCPHPQTHEPVIKGEIDRAAVLFHQK